MPTPIEEMELRLEELNEQAIEIQAVADTEKRDLTAEEQGDLDQRLNQYETLEVQLKQRRRLDEQTLRLRNPVPIVADTEGENRQTVPDIPGRTAGTSVDLTEEQRASIRVTERAVADPRWGWRSFGEFGAGVIEASKRGGVTDERFTRALSIYGSEAVGADGGFAVPPDFKSNVMVELEGEESLLARTDQLSSGSNSLTVPKDETTPWQTAGGVLPYWTGEAGAITQSKPSLETVTVKLHKLAVLVPLTDELMEDAPALNGWLNRKVPQKLASAINLAIVSNNALAKPRHHCLIGGGTLLYDFARGHISIYYCHS